MKLGAETVTNTPGAERIRETIAARRHVSMPSRIAKPSTWIGTRVLAVLAGAVAIALVSAIALPATASAQAGGAPGAAASGGIGEELAPSASTAAPPTSPSTISTKAPVKAVTRESKRPRAQSKRPRKDPNWVIQSKVQLALEADPRFKNVHATVTQPGVIVLEGDVFGNKAKAAAERTAAQVEGVTRVINALKTTSLDWLVLQNRINQALQRSGYPLVSVKVIGNTAYLSGQVKTAVDKERVVTVVRSAGPDLTIGTNLIIIKP